MPDSFSELMATFFGNMMPWLVFAWTLSTYFFIMDLNDSLYLKIIKYIAKYPIKEKETSVDKY